MDTSSVLPAGGGSSQMKLQVERQTEPQTGWRQSLPHQILTGLPLTLFFPVGVMYAGVLLFYISLLVSGGYLEKMHRIRQSAMLLPILGLSLVSIVLAAMQDIPPEISKEFWPGLVHYQTYLFLLPFLTVAAGVWQRRAMYVFFAGAVLAATLFVANFFHLLPVNTVFRSYVIYEGNKSILLGILMAIAATWMLHDLRSHRNHLVWRVLAIVYVAAALVLLAKTRTASLLFFILCGVLILRQIGWSWRVVAVPLILLAALGGGWKYALSLPPPAACEVRLVQAGPWEIFKLRSLCTVHQLHDFSQGRKVNDDGMRLELYKITSEIIAEKPLAGHGIATWMYLYQNKARGLISSTMTTPHNDYLLYLTEVGVIGLLALLAIWATQYWVAYRMAVHENPNTREMAMPLLMLTIAMMLGGMFNAILRDAVFGMAFMILLAIPLAGMRNKN
ncbi:O-antigen ligase family protein [Undibacterium sp. Tian12W]|uniref:O-antigen ligase family protein n=1 Tax=Undibacterium sp. Tian12W TaxID=3413054 RepID=UPI003BF2C439